MVISRVFEPPNVLVATVTGLMTSRDQAALVDWVRDSIRYVGHVRLLVLLDRFAGWTPEVALGSPADWLSDNDPVLQMAIVGPDAWRLSVLAFIAQPLRRTPIEYFESETAARRWLGAACESRAVIGE